jgi:hypothetical protein
MKNLLLIGAALLTLTTSFAWAASSNVPGCFTRTYDRAHLAKHADQTVTAVKLHINRTYDFSLAFNVRGKNTTLKTEGSCKEDARRSAKGLKCQVECDGGGVHVVHRATDLMMYLDRIRVTASCGDDAAEAGEELSGGKDDREFRLDRVNDSVCNGMTP